MKEKDVHRLIEEQNTEKKAAMYAEFQSKHNLTAEKTVTKKKKHGLVVSCAVAALVAVCLIIAIPIMLKNNERSSMRYCSISDCIPKDIDCTVKDYAADKGLPLLYIDWYDKAETIITRLLVNKDDEDDIIYIHELIQDGETGDIVDLAIVEQNIIVDSLAFYDEACTRTTTISNISVDWYYRNRVSAAIFKFNGYKYYIVLDEPMEEEAVLQIVEEMLNR